MGSFFSSKTTQNQKQSSSSTPTFADPRAQALIDQISRGNSKNQSDRSKYLQGQGVQQLQESLGQGAATVDATGAMDAIRRASDAQTPLDVAKVRSQFYNRPTGRNDIAVADTVSRNAAARDAAMYNTKMGAEQYNASAQNARMSQQDQLGQYLANYLDPNQQQQNVDNQSALQLLSLLRGENSTGTGSGVGTARKPGSEIAGSMIGAIGSMMAMCWVARAVYGEHNPTWKVFREWMFMEAPEWLFQLYLKHGEAFAEKVKKDEKLAKRVKKKMDSIIANHFKIIRN